MSCTACDKTRLARLDQHLLEIHEIAGKDREQILNEAKHESIKRGLAELRSSEPTPPLVSELNLGTTVRVCATTQPPTSSYSPPAQSDRTENTLGESEACPSTSTSTVRKPSPKGTTPKVSHRFATSVVGKPLEDF